MSNPFSQTAVVRLVNRVIGPDGKRVPHEYMVGGVAFWIHEYLDVPVEYAELLIHQSMYKIDPVSNRGDYRLGCEKFGVPVTDVPLVETERAELIDRSLLSPLRQKLKPTRFHNPIRRMDPMKQADPRAGDGAFPGEFGDRK